MMRFSVSDVEEARYRAWYTEHQRHCASQKEYPNVKFTFEQTGIGDGIVISCECGRSIDVTDVGSW